MARQKVKAAADPMEGLSSRTRHILALSILFILPVLLFSSTVIGDQQFMGHDTIQWRAGAESIYDYRAEHDGEEPLWAENMFGGMPAYTIAVSKTVPHLDTLFDQFRVIWPAIPYWVLLGGLYLLFLLMRFRPLPAALGAILFSFTTYIPIIIGAGHNIKFIAYSWIPWMLSGYWLMSRSDKRGWGFFLFAVATTLHFRASHPQVTYYFVYLFVGLYLYDSWWHYKTDELKRWGVTTALITGALVLALLGVAEQYLRLLEYSPHSIRGGSAIADIAQQGGLSIDYAFAWSQGILETLTLIVPDLFGGSSSMSYWGEKSGTSGPHYLGAVTFLLLLFGIFRSHRRVTYLFLGVGLLTITFAWGYHFPLNTLWFNLLPGFDKFRTPEMWLTVTTFTFTVVALFGLEAILRSAGEGRKVRNIEKRDRSKGKGERGTGREGRNILGSLYLPAGVAIGTGVILLVGSSLFLPFENDRERGVIAQQLATQSGVAPDHPQVTQRVNQILETQVKPERRELARNDTLRYLLITGVTVGLIVWFIQGKLAGSYLVLSLIVLASMDMLTVSSRYISDSSLVSDELELTEVIESMGSPADYYLRERMEEEPYPWRVLPLDDNPFNNAIPSYFYPSIGGYSGAKLSIIQDVIDEGLFTGPEGVNRPLLDMLNVRYVTSRRPLPLRDFSEIHDLDTYNIYENETVLPKAWFVEEVVTASTPLEAFQLILPQQEFDPVRTAVVEGTARGDVRPDAESSVEVTRYTSRRINMEITRSEPGFLVLSEIWYPDGWVALLNGEEIPIHKTNYLLRGFEIPAGIHQLELEFDPASQRVGAGLSQAATALQLLIGIGLLVTTWRRRPDEDPDA